MKTIALLLGIVALSFGQSSFTDSFSGTTLNSSNWNPAITNSTGSVTVNNGITIIGPGENGISTVNSYDRTANNLTFSVTLTLNSLSSPGFCPNFFTIGYTATAWTSGNASLTNAIWDNGGDFQAAPYVPATTPNGVTLTSWLGYDKQSQGTAYTACNAGNTITLALNINKLQGASISYNGTVSETMFGGPLTSGYFFFETSGTVAYTISSASVTVTPVTGPAAPTGLVATGLNGAALVQWTDTSCTPVDHFIQYKTTGSYTAYSHRPTVYPAITVTGLTNGTTYTFQVACEDSTGVGTLSSTVTAIPSATATALNFPGYYIHPGAGQSNMVGNAATPALSTSEPSGFTNKMLNAGFNGLTALVEQSFNQYAGQTDQETHNNGFCDWLTNTNTTSYPPCIAVIAALGSTAYLPDPGVALRNYDQPLAYHQRYGSTNETYPAGAIFGALQTYTQDAVNLAVAGGKNAIIGSIALFLGASDDIQLTPANTMAYDLQEFAQDMSLNLTAITGQPNSVPTFYAQSTVGVKYPGTVGTFNIGGGTLGEYLAATVGGSDCSSPLYGVVPEYIFDLGSDGQHFTNYSQRRLGEYFAKVHHIVVDQGQCFKPVIPVSITYSGSTVRAKFHVPVQPLVIDTTAVTAADDGHYGFEYYDTNAFDLPASVNSGSTTITLTVATASQNALIQANMFVNCNAAGFPLGTKVVSVTGGTHTNVTVTNMPTNTIASTPCSFNTQQISGLPTIDSTNTDTVIIPLSGTPTGVSPRLRYAYTIDSYPTISGGIYTGAHQLGSARGNIRDSDSTAAYYCDSHVPTAMGCALADWAFAFDAQILPDTRAASTRGGATMY